MKGSTLPNPQPTRTGYATLGPLVVSATTTYSEPKVTRDDTSAAIEFDMTIDGIPSYEVISLNVEGGELLVTDRTLAAALTSLLVIPAPILPVFLAEAQRLAEVIS